MLCTLLGKNINGTPCPLKWAKKNDGRLIMDETNALLYSAWHRSNKCPLVCPNYTIQNAVLFAAKKYGTSSVRDTFSIFSPYYAVWLFIYFNDAVRTYTNWASWLKQLHLYVRMDRCMQFCIYIWTKYIYICIFILYS